MEDYNGEDRRKKPTQDRRKHYSPAIAEFALDERPSLMVKIEQQAARIAELEQQRQFWYDGAKLLGDKCDLLEQQRGEIAAPEVWVVDPEKMDTITPECLEYAKSMRESWKCPENGGFAIEMAYQYGATVIDDDCELLAITAENMVNIMAALGFEHRQEGDLGCIACDPINNVPVPRGALRAVLAALIGNPHEIRELQATRMPEELFKDNPINVLVKYYQDTKGTGQ